MKKISVCVPAYNRPETLKQLINSFIKQSYVNKELVISDDTPNDSIRNLIKNINNKSVVYFHNSPGLGFSRNLLKSMERATGEYLLILGDDDLLLDSSSLSEYVNVFDNDPNIGFIYSNLLQFSDKLNIETSINFASKSKKYKKGKDAMENMWMKSIFIGGIGIRNIGNLSNLYPSKKILHPQVELIGNILNQSDAYLLAKNCIGFRSHDDQIIFRALKNKNIRQGGEHMTVEILNIFNYLNKKYHLEMNFDFAAKELISQQMVMMFKEKSNLGSQEMEKYYKKFCNTSSVAKNSLKLKTAYLLAKYLPVFLITLMRRFALELIALKERTAHKQFKKQLFLMIAD